MFLQLCSPHESGWVWITNFILICDLDAPWQYWNGMPAVHILCIIFEDIRRSNIIYYFSEFSWWQSQLCRSQSSLLIILFRLYIIRHLKLVKCLFCYAFHILFWRACLPDDSGDIFDFSFSFSLELRVWKLGNSFYLYYLFVSNLLGLFLFNSEQMPEGVSANMFL